jgi:hypothetical protein
VSRAFAGAAVAGVVSFAVFMGIFSLVLRFPDDLDRRLLLVVIMPLLFLGSMIAGFLSGVITRMAVAVLWALAAIAGGLVGAAMLLHPFTAPDAASIYAIVIAFAILPAAVAHLIAVAFRPGAVRA